MMKYSDRPNAYINAKDLEIAIVKATSYGDALDALREAPSIDTVRCRECKWWNCEMSGCKRNPSVVAWRDDDFCSYGEREGE